MSIYLRDNHPRIGDIYMMQFYGQGSAQYGNRPGLIIQNDLGNRHSPNVVALPLTSSLKNLNQPTHVLLTARETGLRKDSVVICESPMSIPKEHIGAHITRLPNHLMKQIAMAFLLEHPMLCFLDNDDVKNIKEEAYSLIAV